MLINQELAALYLKHKLVAKSQLNPMVEEFKGSTKRLDNELLAQHLVTEEGNAVVLAEYFDMEFADISLIEPDPKCVHLVTPAFVRRHTIIPIAKQNGELIVAISNPFDYEGLRRIHSFAKGRIKVLVSTKTKIDNIANLIFSKTLTAEAITSFTEVSLEEKEKLKGVGTVSADLYGGDIKSAPAVKLTDSIFREGIAHRASDIHIEPFEKNIRVRYRVDGALYEASSFDIELYPALLTRVKIMSGINIAEKRIPQDGRIKQKINDIEYDFRVSTLPTVYGERIVIRILDTEAFAFDRPQLGFLPVENKMVDKMLQHPHGIILLTGPTGCGKSTTLYSFIKELNAQDRNIITVEDPVEYTIHGVNQVQVNPKANLTFASALRSILRQDPNVIMIGEIRDEETAQIAIRAAITGHLVLSTLHTNDAPGSITRLIDMGIEPYFVADAVVGIVAQRLVRRLCNNCKVPVKTSEAEMKLLKLTKPHTIYKAKGCPACHNTGYKGRMGVHEILFIDEEIQELIQKRASTEEIRKLAVKKGMLSLYDTCREGVLSGVTSLSELASIIYEAE
jgi:type IV pilus assembly protein PilB